jgi:hypothetical protein
MVEQLPISEHKNMVGRELRQNMKAKKSESMRVASCKCDSRSWHGIKIQQNTYSMLKCHSGFRGDTIGKKLT